MINELSRNLDDDGSSVPDNVEVEISVVGAGTRTSDPEVTGDSISVVRGGVFDSFWLLLVKAFFDFLQVYSWLLLSGTIFVSSSL